MKEVAQLLGVELEEEFNIEGYNYNPYKFTNDGLLDNNNYSAPITLYNLMIGIAKIVKLQFKPKECGYYWYYNQNSKLVYQELWVGTVKDYTFYKVGNCFRTQKEAETKGKGIMEAIVKEYEDE